MIFLFRKTKIIVSLLVIYQKHSLDKIDLGFMINIDLNIIHIFMNFLINIQILI
jgi:hypothetical protein